MKELRNILRESLPEMIGGLSVAFLLAVLSLLYTNLGIIGVGLILVSIVVVIVLWATFKRRRQAPSPKTSPFVAGLSTQQTRGNLPIRSDTIVKFDANAMESIFYRAATFRHEVGGVLIGAYAVDEIHIKRVHDGFETDLSKVQLASGESVVGYWHSHPNYGTFLSSTDQAVMKQTPDFVSVIVDTSSKQETFAAYGIADDKIVKLKVS